MEINGTSSSYGNELSSKKICKENDHKSKNGCCEKFDDSQNGNCKIADSEFLATTMRLLEDDFECNSLHDLTDKLRTVFDHDNVNIEYVRALMSAYKSNPAEWLKFAKFDKYKYTRNLVDSGNGKYNLMILCWGEGHGSSIHDHSNSHCFMKVLAGSLCEIRFQWPDKKDESNEVNEDSTTMKEISRAAVGTNDVCYINDSLGLHRVENLSHTDCAVSLHLYCPPFDSCYVFNQTTGHKIKTQVTFWSIFGERQVMRSRNRDRGSSPEDN